MQLSELQLNVPVLCVLINRPCKFNKDFIPEFSDFVAGITVMFDRFVSVGDVML